MNQPLPGVRGGHPSLFAIKLHAMDGLPNGIAVNGVHCVPKCHQQSGVVRSQGLGCDGKVAFLKCGCLVLSHTIEAANDSPPLVDAQYENSAPHDNQPVDASQPQAETTAVVAKAVPLCDSS